jgi:hypothetical protein
VITTVVINIISSVFAALSLIGPLHPDSNTESRELGRTELMTIAQSILYASEYSNGKLYKSLPYLYTVISSSEVYVEV